MRPTGDRVSARMERVREALKLEGPLNVLRQKRVAALTEVEEWEARQAWWTQHNGGLLARAEAAEAALKDEMKWDMGGVPENEWKARAEAAEQEERIVSHQLERRTAQLAEITAERDRLKAALEQIVDESPHNFNARLIARAALGEPA